MGSGRIDVFDLYGVVAHFPGSIVDGVQLTSNFPFSRRGHWIGAT